MRCPRTFALALCIAPLLLGCEPKVSSTPADEKVSDAADKIQDAAEATADAARAKFDEYASAMNTRLDELNAKLDDLKDRAAQAEGEAKVALERKLEQAKAKRDAAAEKLDELKQTGADR